MEVAALVVINYSLLMLDSNTGDKDDEKLRSRCDDLSYPLPSLTEIQ